MNKLKEHEMLSAMIERPALYFGNRLGYLRELAAFDFGYCTGQGADEKSRPDRLIPAEFGDFVREQVKVGSSGPTFWALRIEAASNSEDEAWSLFIKLWSEFEESCGREGN